MEDLRNFLNGLRKHWGALVTGGCSIGAVGIWQGWGHPVKPWAYWIIASAGILGAAFFAWRDERRQAEGQKKLYEEECAKRGSPNFILQIGQVRYDFDPDFNLTNLLVPCNITNSGAPSHAAGWSATIRKTSGQETVTNVNFRGESSTGIWVAGNS